jgi:hypothetical protein
MSASFRSSIFIIHLLLGYAPVRTTGRQPFPQYSRSLSFLDASRISIVTMSRFDSTDELIGGQRLTAIAEILAQGVMRLRRRRLSALGTQETGEKPPRSAAPCLEVSAESVLSVHTG